MPSPALQIGRVSLEHHCYVVTTVTSQRRRLFADPLAAQEMIRWIQASDSEGRTRSMAWVVMPDHVHWMFALRAGTLATVMRTTKSCAAKAINLLNNTQGAVWQPGYYDQLQRNERQWLGEAAYILANPVRAGLASAIGEYPFAWCRWGAAA